MMKYFLLILIIILSGCSAKYEVTDITNAAPGASVNGIPYRVKGTYKTHLYTYDKVKSAYEYDVRDVTIPGPDRVYAVGFNARYLSDNTLNITQNPDGTLNIVKLSSDDKVISTANTTIDQLVEIDKAVEAQIEKDKQDKAASEASEFEKSIAVTNAFNTVSIAQAALNDAINAGDKENIIAQKRADLLIAQIKANQACEKFPSDPLCVVSPPFPEVDVLKEQFGGIGITLPEEDD